MVLGEEVMENLFELQLTGLQQIRYGVTWVFNSKVVFSNSELLDKYLK